MAAKKTSSKKPTPKSTTGKGKPNMTYDSHRMDSRSYGMGTAGNKRGRSNPGTSEKVSGNRIKSKNTMVTQAWAGGGPAYEVWNMKTSDALVKPRVKKNTSKKK